MSLTISFHHQNGILPAVESAFSPLIYVPEFLVKIESGRPVFGMQPKFGKVFAGFVQERGSYSSPLPVTGDRYAPYVSSFVFCVSYQSPDNYRAVFVDPTLA